jgi:hypothetical protein
MALIVAVDSANLATFGCALDHVANAPSFCFEPSR